MKKDLIRSKSSISILIPLLLLVSMLTFGCSAASALIPVASTAPSQAMPSKNTPAAETVVPSQTGNTVQSNLDCQAIGDAFINFEQVYPTLGIVSNGAAADVTTPGTPFYIDFAKLRSNYDLLAMLPDSPTFGKTSDAIAQFRQLTDLVENNIKAGVTPTSGNSGNGKDSVTLYLKLSQPFIIVGDAFATACPNYSAPTAITPTP